MRLTQLAAKPQLVKMSIDDEETVKQYGEPIDFWIWDRQPMEKFIKLAQTRTDNIGDLLEIVNDMALDEDGTPILKDGLVLPVDVLSKVVSKVVETLGK